MLGVEVLRVGSDAPATRPLRGKLREWLSSLDADQLIASGSLGADGEPESYDWAQRDRYLIFEAYPLAPDHRGPGGRIIGEMRPAEASVIDDVKPLRKRLAEKAKAYGKLDAPYIVAIDAVGEFTEDRDFLSALYGTTTIRYYENPGPDAPPPTHIRQPDGLWIRPRSWHHTHISAVLTSTNLMPWTVGSAVPTLWHHPAADLPVDGICPLLRQARPDPASRQIRYSEPEVTPHEFFGLPEGWPARTATLAQPPTATRTLRRSRQQTRPSCCASGDGGMSRVIEHTGLANQRCRVPTAGPPVPAEFP
jgi:hypothetical protein